MFLLNEPVARIDAVEASRTHFTQRRHRDVHVISIRTRQWQSSSVGTVVASGTDVSSDAISGRGNCCPALAEVPFRALRSDVDLTLSLAVVASVARDAVADVITRRVGKVAACGAGHWVAGAFGTIVTGRADITVVLGCRVWMNCAETTEVAGSAVAVGNPLNTSRKL